MRASSRRCATSPTIAVSICFLPSVSSTMIPPARVAPGFILYPSIFDLHRSPVAAPPLHLVLRRRIETTHYRDDFALLASVHDSSPDAVPPPSSSITLFSSLPFSSRRALSLSRRPGAAAFSLLSFRARLYAHTHTHTLCVCARKRRGR